MTVGVTVEGSAQSSATTVTVSSITVGASDTNLVAYAQQSSSGGSGTSSGTKWDLGTPENFTEESDGTWFSGDARNLFAYLHNPTAATDDVVHTASAAPDEHILIVWSVTGGDSSVRTAPTAETASGASVLTMTNANTQSGDAVFYGFGLIDGGGGSPAVSSYDQGTSQGADETFAYVLGAGCFEAATSTSETGGVTSSQSGDTREISLAIPAGASGTTITLVEKSFPFSAQATNINDETFLAIVEKAFQFTGQATTEVFDRIVNLVTASFKFAAQAVSVSSEVISAISNHRVVREVVRSVIKHVTKRFPD